jgi:uncharacterized protein YraI
MTIRKKLLAAGLAGLALAATATAALAAPAVATSNVNVRSGPGTGYGIVDTLRRGEPVEIVQCQGSWCYIEKAGPDGWVSANYLSRGGRPGWNDDYYPPRPPVYNPPRPRPPVYTHPRPPRPDWGYPRPPRPDWNYPRPPRPDYGYPRPVRPGSDASFCFNGPNGYFCAGT